MTPIKFRETEKIYHYTTKESGKAILSSMRLRMSPQSKMNDINEYDRRIFTFGCELEDIEAEMSKYYQSSFTLDNVRVPGFAIPTMWGHYAEQGRGICLVFDKEKLRSRIYNLGYFQRKVDYLNDYDPSIIVNDKNPEQYVLRNMKQLFFTKSKDWSYEREYRVISRSNVEPAEIDISDCIIAVIVNNFKDIDCNEQQTNSPTYKTLINSLKGTDIPVLLLNMAPLNGKYELINYEPDINGKIWYPKQSKIIGIDI